MIGWRHGAGAIGGIIISLAIAFGPTLARLARPALETLAPGDASDPAPCRVQYPGNVQPAYVHKGLDRRTTTICYHAYSIGYSGLTRTPLWSAERLTADTVDHARDLARVDQFHPDDHLPGRDRSTLDDYRRSGFDRGHMTPSGDMPTPKAQAESFSLANIVPQTPELNRHLWSDIEHDVRQLARSHTAIFVVTGPVFTGSQLDSLGGRVAVPTSTYKAVYIPGAGAGAYLATNTHNPRLTITSIARLTATTGIDPFPGVDQASKDRTIHLPRPRSRSSRGHHATSTQQ